MPNIQSKETPVNMHETKGAEPFKSAEVGVIEINDNSSDGGLENIDMTVN